MWRTGMTLAAVTLLSVATAGAQEGAGRPGVLNYVQGEVTLDGQALSGASIPGAEMAPGQQLVTKDGKAEALLTPGIFLRLDADSAVKLLQRPAEDLRLEVLRGHAVVEAAELHGAIQVFVGPMHARLERPGVYEFDAGSPAVTAFAGRAHIQANDQTAELRSGRILTLSGNSFTKKKLGPTARDGFYAWNASRSHYEAQVSNETAMLMAGTSTRGWHGGDWYWNPYLSMWAFMPSDAVVPGPFGDSFFSPVYYDDSAEATHSRGYWDMVE